MRRSENEITDRSEIEAVLDGATIVHIAMSDGDGPYVVPVNFGYRDSILYFHCAAEGRKLDVLGRNPRVCFAAETDVALRPGDSPCKWSVHYRSAIGFGTAFFVEGLQEKALALDVIMSHYASPPFSFADNSLRKAVVVGVRVESLTGKQNGYPATSGELTS